MTQPQQSADLAVLRQQIDSLDKQLLQLLNERAHVAEQVGEIKRKEGSAFFRPDRVAQVIHNIEQANPGPLLNRHVASIWREIMSACLALEAPQRVAVLGPQGTFCEQAAIEFFGSAADFTYCANFDEVFHATAAGTAQYGVVGVENSTEGVVARSLDLFLRSPVHVIGEVSLLVRHNLLRQSNTTEGIEVVLAHPQALAQCQGWLSQHLPNVERRAVSSNAEGARLAASNPTWAGIASERAASQFGLHIVAHAIQDEAYNRTRAVVGLVLNGMGHDVQTELTRCTFAGNTCPRGVAGGQSCALGIAGHSTTLDIGQVLRQPALTLRQGLGMCQHHLDAFGGIALAQ